MKAIFYSALWCLSCAVAISGQPLEPAPAEEIEYHWKQVKDYRQLLDNPDNWERDPGTGFNTISPPDIQPSLAFLVAQAEMQYADLVFPDVPKTRETTRHWLNWASEGKAFGVRPGLWEMTGTPGYGEAFGITGQPRVHLKIWYDESILDDIKQLVQELQSLEATTRLIQDIDRLRNPPAKRQVADPNIPDHPRRAELLGQWREENEVIYEISKNEAGAVILTSVEAPPWDTVINKVRWEGDTLRFDQYHYLSDPDNPGFEHPFNGVRMANIFIPQDASNRLVHRAETEHLKEPLESELQRVPVE